MSSKPFEYLPEICSPTNPGETYAENFLDLDNGEEKRQLLLQVDPAQLSDQQLVDIAAVICYYLAVIPRIIKYDVEGDVRAQIDSASDRLYAFFGRARVNIPNPGYYISDIGPIIELAAYPPILRRKVEDLMSALNGYAATLQAEMSTHDLSDVCTTHDMAWWGSPGVALATRRRNSRRYTWRFLMSQSVLLELLHQTNYVDELEYFTSIVVDDLLPEDLMSANGALTATLMEIDSALRFDAANDIEFEDAFGANIIVILGTLARKIGEIQHKMAVLHNI